MLVTSTLIITVAVTVLGQIPADPCIPASEDELKTVGAQQPSEERRLVALCPDPSDTLWVADSTRPVSESWALCLVDWGCRSHHRLAAATDRISHDPRVLELYAAILRGQRQVPFIDEPYDSAVALHFVAWNALLVHLDLLLRFTDRQPQSAELEYSHMPFGVALGALARYARTEPAARQRISDLLEDGESPWVRAEAFSSLLRLNDEWARARISQVPLRELTFAQRELRARVLSAVPCKPDTYWYACWGVEGQAFQGCGGPLGAWRSRCAV